jgi:hypothetical protein
MFRVTFEKTNRLTGFSVTASFLDLNGLCQECLLSLRIPVKLLKVDSLTFN